MKIIDGHNHPDWWGHDLKKIPGEYGSVWDQPDLAAELALRGG